MALMPVLQTPLHQLFSMMGGSAQFRILISKFIVCDGSQHCTDRNGCEFERNLIYFAINRMAQAQRVPTDQSPTPQITFHVAHSFSSIENYHNREMQLDQVAP